MSRARGGSLVGIASLASLVGLAVVAFPLDVLARCALVVVVLALCAAVAVGAKATTKSFMKWAVALFVVGSVWPPVSSRVRQGLVAAFPGGLRPGLGGARPSSGSLDGVLYDLTTLLLVVGLMLLAAGVLLLSSRIRAGLRPPPAPPRPQARRRGRLVDPRAEVQLRAQTADHQAADDFGLLGGQDGR